MSTPAITYRTGVGVGVEVYHSDPAVAVMLRDGGCAGQGYGMVAAENQRNRARLQRLHCLQANRIVALFKGAWRTYGVAEVHHLDLSSRIQVKLHVI